jgi:hypothetical protein
LSSSSSSNGETENIILANIELFRQYSLDQGLLESYFNDGVFFRLVDLDGGLSSSSSSSDSSFLLTINLEKRSRPLEDIPSDIVWYVYDEEIGGLTVSNLVSVTKKDERTLEVSLVDPDAPDGEIEFSFRLNIEHQSLAPSRTKYVFRRSDRYSARTTLSNSLSGTRGRLGEVYVQYLLGWISDFWYAWDAGDMSLVPPLTSPFPNSFAPFYPFAHALWRLKEDLGVQIQVSGLAAPIEFSEGNEELIKNQNFLGLPPNIWSCIGQDLYKFDGYADEYYNTPDKPKPPRQYKDPDTSFDCRSLSVLGAQFLRDQLAGICPNAVVSVIGIGTHYLCYVDLSGAGEGSTCCSGQFLYEPQDGTIYKDAKEFCDEDPAVCETLDKEPTLYEPGQENSDGDFGDPNWEDDAGELQRIEGVICGCLSGNYENGTNEANLKQVCDNGQMQDWVANNLSFSPEQKDGDGNVTSPPEQPGLDTPQILVCKNCVVTWTATYNCASEDENGEAVAANWELITIPESKCLSDEDMPQLEVWLDSEAEDSSAPCMKVMNFSFPDVSCGDFLDCLSVTAPEPKQLPEGEPAGCCGSWCVKDESGAKTGQCYHGSVAAHEAEESAGNADAFNLGKTCDDLDCCPPGYRKSGASSPFMKSLAGVCVPDCNHPDHACETGYCCVENPFAHGSNINSCIPCDGCCEPDLILGGQMCVPCDKTRSIWFVSQSPEDGNSPWG